MRYILILCFFISGVLYAQNATIAKNYFEKGEYEKALIEYKKLYAKSSSNITYITQIISTYQQLEQYDEAEKFILDLMERVKYPAFIVELGYNYQLKNNLEKANEYYKLAISKIDERATNVYAVARSFQNHSLLNEAVIAYEKAVVLNPDLNFNVQLAQIYGEQGNIEKMFNSYLNFAESNPLVLRDVKRAINDFISEDSSNENNVLLRKLLLKKMQQEPNTLWNELLSWLFIQQKDLKKAFAQEKAIYKRQPESLSRIEELALIAVNDNENEVAQDVLNYIIETAPDAETKLRAHHNLIKIDLKSDANYGAIKSKYLELLKTYGEQPETLELQIAYGHFLAFYLNETKEATNFLESTLKLPLSTLEKAQVKLELGDILILQEKFNKALIYYTQIQRNLKNSTISQQARFKVAKASYYKGDFKWAESQLKILKASTSQLIANDALDLKLLISDNKYEDSLQTALKLYAKADLLAFQNRNDEAITLLDTILEAHKTEPIIAQALYKQAQLFELKLQYDKAAVNYQAMIDNYKDGILIDDALFHLAEIYQKQLNLPEKAKGLYEQIIFNHADSIYFVDARKRYRTLRGDAIN
ncbi:tetratricopeptide repeat protein [Algibacter amylolyticus]|uniref:Tetratricopeptide repeat protein n=1 Tax=Algibacter amylolyticus TaxID=1608400 RepID=A0A5M7BDY6_9FLAO|nr:tetratricopeptide repeat protein [Algibacter amylolyticus]KAA5827619.1 tetratricopeptide repeat protein [Algibacter amylolyticus]MBB5266831.1 tetratricopeptide (TPR) repeat protein [Algibacter amylolyticus]TSJ81864.1 tetratricopeptide repeat protein [Algibacter amylolyticus]